MAEALNFPIEIVGCPTLRDPDGLAMSSRNQYLRRRNGSKALSISRASSRPRRSSRSGVTQTNRLIATMQKPMLEQHLSIDYVAAVDPVTLKNVEVVTGPTVLAVAARVGEDAVDRQRADRRMSIRGLVVLVIGDW